ncbi:ATP-binding protein [Patescibacteria group bacterium]|nr:ATP-binding protein [Patescibacteria group bacterium]
MNPIKTNWYVITGGPSSGKTTTVNLLAGRGYKTTIEHARHYIDTQKITGKTVEEIRANQLVFQRGVLDMQIAQENELTLDEAVFLDRALPDALAYYRFLNLPEDRDLLQALQAHLYKKVFILDPLPLVKDYARTENSNDQNVIHGLLIEAYESLGYHAMHVPVLPPEERVDFILKNV